MERNFGVKRRGDKWAARPYVRGLGHVWGGTWDTREEALKAAMRILDEECRLAGRETVASFAARWIVEYPRPKASTNDIYVAVAARFATEFGDRFLHRVTIREAREYAMAHRSDAFALSAMFRDARREGLVLANPFHKLRIPRGRGRRDIEVVTEDELEELASLAREVHAGDFGITLRAALLFAAYTGVRPGELFGLDWSDLDLEAAEAHVRRQFHRGQETTPKSGRVRRILVPPPAIEALRGLPERRVICPVTRGHVVFPASSDRRLTSSGLGKAWQPVRARFEASLMGSRRAEFERVKGSLDFYAVTRHFCATRLVEAGVEAWAVAQQLGHMDGGRLVQDTYGHPREKVARERLRAAFANAPTPPDTRPEPAPVSIAQRAKLALVQGGAR